MMSWCSNGFAFPLIVLACGGPSPATPPPAETATPMVDAAPPAPTASAAPVVVDAGAPSLTAKTVPLPHATAPVSLDYVAYEPARKRVWVPIMTTGSVGVFDTASGSFAEVTGFKTEERTVRDKKRIVGPSAASVGDGVVYVGNRATSEVCPVDTKTLKTGTCFKLKGSPDGVCYVPSAKEVWVTTPHEQTLVVLDATKPEALKQKTTIKTDGDPEGYAVDESRGLFFTNMEDKGGTVAIDIKTHAIKSTWNPACGSDGPRGLAVDAAHAFVIVACTDHVQVLDAAGALLGKLDTGAGVDNIDFLASKRLVYVAASKDARLTVAHLDDKGQLTVTATAPTSASARNAVADEAGNAYVPDAQAARLYVVTAPP